MRKTLAAAAVLLLMPLALLLAADAALRGTEEAVEIRETVLSGDRSAARGVDLTFHVQSEGHLFWDTAVSLGTETLSPETAFAFSQRERREEEPFVPWAEISISRTNYGISSSGGIDFAEERWVSRELMLLPAADVAERTAPGRPGRRWWRWERTIPAIHCIWMCATSPGRMWSSRWRSSRS